VVSVSFNDVTSAAQAAANFDASVVYSQTLASTDQQGNFNMISGALQSNLDSENYSNSGFLSRHIGISQVRSEHISAQQVQASKITSNVVGLAHVEVQSTKDAVRAVRIQTGLPEFGAEMCRVSGTKSREGSTIVELTVNFSSAIDGVPAFSGQPTPAGRVMFSAPGDPPKYVILTALTNSFAAYSMMWNNDLGTNSVTYTFYAEYWGVKSG
jgi:hypothetical protein